MKFFDHEEEIDGVREWVSDGVGFLTQRREDAECAEMSRVWEWGS